MTGGEISENYACGSGSVGGGVYLNASGSMTVGETAVVRDNKAGATFDSGSATGGSANNVYLVDGKKITCGTGTAEKPVLDDGAYIGVTTETEPSAGSPVAITGNNSNNYSTYFHSDNASYAMQNTGTGLGQVVELALRSTTPTATTTTVAKTTATQKAVSFTLTNTPALTGTWKVYADNSTTTVHSTVAAAISGSTLTLTDSGSDIAAETYYVAVTETGKAESGRLALTVGAYAGNTVDYAMDFMQTHEESWGAFSNHNFSTTDASGTGWSWDASEKTLTLSGLNFTTTARDAMYLPDDAKIVLQNGTTNTVKSVISGEENSIDSTGIHAAGKLEISGSGTLNVASGGVVSEGDNGSKSSIGIYGENDITISGAVTVNATGGTVTGNSSNRNNGNSSYGVCSYNGTVSVTGSATVNATGGTVTASGDEYAMSYGILADRGSVEVKGGTVTATGGTATAGNGSGESCGICSGGNTTISGGTVTATGGTASSRLQNAVNSDASFSYGIRSYYTIISGGTVTAETTSTITTGQKSAFLDLPKLDGYASYQWRTASSGAYTPSTTTKYTDNANHSYVEIKPYTAPSSPSTDDSYTPPLVTEIKQGGSTTADNLSQLISGKKDLTVTGASGAKLVFDTAALKGIEAKTTGSVTVKIENVSKAHQNMEGKNVFSLTVESGSKTVTDFGGRVTVALPYTLKEGEKGEDVSVWYLASDGVMTEIACTYDAKTGLATFTVTHFSEYVVGVSEWVNPFSDVKETDWFYDDAAFVAAKSLMSGTSATTFAPYENTSRGMIVTILYRLEGQPAVTGANPFDDVQSGKYYESAIIWAAQNGIVSGYGNGKFGPDDDISREQLAAILYRYAQHKGYDVSVGEDTNILSYNDAFDISKYAIPAMQWACGAGLINGDNGNLMPKGNAERCQVAAILHRFDKVLAK